MKISFSFMVFLFACGVFAGDSASWRSRLYPENWSPDFTDSEGRFLYDFSYAGYHNGEVPLPEGKEKQTFDVVVTYGSDKTGKADATASIQSAINAAGLAGGGIVYLPAGLYRCDGLLVVDKPLVVLRGESSESTRLWFTRVKGMSGQSHITVRGNVKQGVEIPFAEDGTNRSFTVKVQDAGVLAVGDEVSIGWVISDAFIAEHNMTGTWKVFNGQWKPFFRRSIKAIDRTRVPHEIRLDVPLRYPARIRDYASLRIESGYLSECGIESLAVSDAVEWNAAWDERRVHAILLQSVKDCWVQDVISFQSPSNNADKYHLQNGGIMVLDGKRVTVANCRMEKSQNRGSGGCGYLFEVSRSSEILTRDCVAVSGRHNFIQNWDFGTSGCVWLRCSSRGSRNIFNRYDPIGLPAYCEYHHSLAMACLVDQCSLADGWYGGNRRNWSSGAGLTVTQSVYWNTSGGGKILSWQYGIGYVIGTDKISVSTSMLNQSAAGSDPSDFVEGLNLGRSLAPQSLYEDQLKRRIGR